MPSFERSAGASFLDGVMATMNENPVLTMLWVALGLSLVWIVGRAHR